MQFVQNINHQETSCDPWQSLAFAIIGRAADDYRFLARKLEADECEDRNRAEMQMKAISRFFLSNWYCALSGFNNGADVLGRLDEEVFGNDD